MRIFVLQQIQAKGENMIKEDYVEKCKFIMAVLKKIMRGADVPLSERISACEKAIEILCTPDSQTQDNKSKKS